MKQITLLALLLFSTLSFLFANPNDDLIKVGSVTNEIKIGSMIGNRNLEFGIKNIVEELLMDMNYDISDILGLTSISETDAVNTDGKQLKIKLK